jgi:hypothetical protein
MAEQYQLPGQFQVPSMAEISYKSGDTDSVDRENANNFIRQWNATTNIENANRMQSLRERQFAQEMVNADRNFQLAKDQQEYNFQAGTRDFDLKKEYQQAQLRNFDLNAQQAQWNLQMQKEDYNNTQEAIKMAPSWRAELDGRLGPSGAYGPDAESIMAEFVLEKGTNLGAQKVLENMIGKLQQTSQNYQNNALNKTIIDTRKAIATNQFGSMKFTDPNLDPEVGEVGANFILTQLQQARAQGRIDDVLLYQGILNQGLSDAAREKQARIQEEATIRASSLGLPVGQVDVKGGEISTRFEAPKVVRGSGTGGGGLKPTEDIAKGVQSFETQRDLKEEAFKRADEALQNIDRDSAGYAVAKAERDRKYSEFQTAQQIVENNARQLAGQPNIVTGNQAPAGAQAPTTTAPSVTPTGAPSIPAILEGGKEKKSTVPTSMTTPDLTAPLLSPQAQRLEQLQRVAEPVGVGLQMINRFAKGATGTELTRTAQEQQPVGQVLQQALGASKELAIARDLKRKAQLAANTRADRGEDPQKAYNEELQKLVAEYQAKNKPTISVR